MIEFQNLSGDDPYIIFKKNYDQAVAKGQVMPQAMCISSFCKKTQEVDSRFVNLKFIDNKTFIFFTNYLSPKSAQFESHNQISAVFFWSKINIQVRIKAKIKKAPEELNTSYFKTRDIDKNALAITSQQSKEIDSYMKLKSKYMKVLANVDLTSCPDYWGGFSFLPYYFEFWEGHPSRINKREVFKIKNSDWNRYLLQP
jgi:pyridoxamine 5'-phosphate oxidase